jgi:hypothetical protein
MSDKVTRTTIYGSKITVVEVSELKEFFCTVCNMAVLHEFEDKTGWTPIEHEAPCDRPCIGGGVESYQYALGDLHRFECATCAEDPERIGKRYGE